MATNDIYEVLRPVPDIDCWVDPCGVLMLKAVTSFGDPVEVTEDGLNELITALQLSLGRLRASEPG